MKKIATFFALLATISVQTFAQDTTAVALNVSNFETATSPTKLLDLRNSNSFKANANYPTPYKTSFKVDGPIIGGGIALTALGVSLIDKKRGLTPAELATKTKDKIPFFDRGNAGFYSVKADKDSYVPFKISFALPIAMLLANDNERHNALQVMVLYTETMAITGTVFTMATGNVYRSRPYVYGNIATPERRMDKNSQRSFFAGHTAATAGATFFAAKMFQDFNPDLKLKPYVWVVAAAVPALVGYLRYKAGMHFLSDNLLGYAVGASAGIFVPQLHKVVKLKNVSMVPEIGADHKGMSVVYNF